MRITPVLALVAAATLAVSACGGGGGADSETIERLRTDAADAELFNVLDSGEQDCVFGEVAKDSELTEAVLSDAEPTDAQAAAVFKILADCAPDAFAQALSQDDPDAAAVFGGLSQDELSCVADALVENPSLLSGDEEALGLLVFDCAPDVAADLFATELGVETDQAKCLIDELGGIEELIALSETTSEDAEVISRVFAAFEACGIDVTTLG